MEPAIKYSQQIFQLDSVRAKKTSMEDDAIYAKMAFMGSQSVLLACAKVNLSCP